MTRRRRILAFLGLGIVGVLVLVQTPWARHALLDRIIAFLHDRHGVALRAERLDLRLHALAVTLHGVALASDEAPDQPMARVARLDIDFSARAMLGRLAFDRVTLVRPLVRLDLTGARRSTTGGARLPPDLEIGFLQIEDLGVDATLAGGVRVAAGGVRASGGGTGQAADLTLQLASLAIDAPSARVRYEGMSGRLALRGGDLVTLSVRADSDAAALRIEGTATLSHPGSLDGRYEANIDLAALGQVISGWPRLAGRLDVRGSIGGARSDPVVTFQALGTRLEWSHLRGARLQATGEMDARRLLLSARLDAGDFGSMVARGSVALDSGTPSQLRAEWTAPRVERWAALKDVGLHHLSATGEVDCRWLGLLPTLEALAGEARIRVHGLEASDRPDARLDLTARRGLVAVAVDAALAGGTRASAHVSTELSARAPGASHLAGTVRLESDDLAAAARQLQARGLNMPTVEALPPARVSLSGVVAGTLETPRLDTSVNGTAVVAPFERVVATGLLSLDREGLRVAPLSVETTDGRAELRGTLRFGDLATAGSFEARLDRLDVIARWLSAGWRPEGRASASGRWEGTLHAPVATARVTASEVSAKGVRFDSLSGDLELAGHEVRAREVLVIQPDGELRAQGNLDVHSGAFSVDARADHVSLWSRVPSAPPPSQVDGLVSTRVPDLRDVSFQVRAIGSLVSYASERWVRVDVLGFDGLVLGRRAVLEGPAAALYRESEVSVVEPARIAFGGTRLAVAGRWGVHHLEVLTVTLDGSVEDLVPLLQADAGAPAWAGEGPLRAQVSFGGSRGNVRISGSASLASASLRRGDQELARDISVVARVGDDAVVVEDASGRVLGGPLKGSGSVPLAWLLGADPAGAGTSGPPPQAAALRGTWQVDVERARRALGRVGPGLRGSATFSIEARAAHPRLEAIDASISGTIERITGQHVPLLERAPVALRVANGRLLVDSLDWTGRDTRLVASGSVGLAPGLSSDLRLDFRSTLRLLDEFLPVRANGRASLEVGVTGSPGDWRPSGTLVLTDCSLVDPRTRVALADWSGTLVLGPDRLHTERMTGQLNGGAVQVTGALAWGDGRAPQLTVRASDVLLEPIPGLRTQVDADLTLVSDAQRRTLSGAVSVTADAYREEVSSIASTIAAFVSRPRSSSAGLPVWLADTALDVRLDAANPVLIENRMVQIELVPSVRLVGTFGQPALAGRVAVVPDGRVQAAGRSYRLNDSAVEFSGRTLVPTFNLSGETKVGSYDVTLRLAGPADGLETSLSSDPPLSERDLRSLLLTGQTTDVMGTDEGSSEFVVGAVSADVLGVAGRFIGLDSISIGTDDFELVSDDVKTARRLTVSKRLGTRFELLFSENLEDDELTWILIYRPRPGWDVRVSSRDNVEQGLEVRREIAFGPGVAVAQSAGRAAATRETVDEVVVTGDPGFDVAEVLAAVKLGAGDRFAFAEWWRDRDRIEEYYRGRGYFAARVVPKRVVTSEQPRRVRLEYRIVRGPQTMLQVVGYDAPPALVERLELSWATVVVPEFLPERLATVARRHLVEIGHLRAEAQVEISHPDDSTDRAVVRVRPGPVTRSRRVAFTGNAAIPTRELVALATPLTAVDAWIDPASLVAAIESEYEARGYPGAHARAGTVVFSGTAATLPIAITEGLPARLRELRLEGLPPAEHEAALAVVDLARGAPITPGGARQARARLERHFREEGYREARVTASARLEPAEGAADLTLTVARGRMFIIRDVRVEGAETTRDSLVRSAVALAPGDAANAAGIAETERRLRGLGVFRSATVHLEPVAATTPADPAAQVDARISLEESRRYQLRFGVQTTSEYEPALSDRTNAGGIAVDLRDRNFAGRAMSLGVGLRYEPSLQSFRTLLAVPRLGSWPVRTNVYGIWRRETADAPSEREYRDDTAVLALEQRWQPRRSLEFAWGYKLDWRDVRFVESPLAERRGFEGVLGSVYGTVMLDRRDSALDATRGWFQSASIQWGARELGSTIDFLRLHLRSSVYLPVGPLVFASGGRIGTVTSFGGRPGPNVDDLFFKAGGTQSVRGYAEDALSAIELQGIPFGGTRVLVLNQEVRFPLVWRFGGVLFADAGNTFVTDAFDLRDLRLGVGFGLRLKTPLAPIRLDLGWPLPNGNEQRSPRWHFSIGQMF